MKHTDYPALYQSASEISQRSQTTFYRTFVSHMALLAIATIISIVNYPCSELAILQACVLLGALGCAIALYFVRPERLWYACRAAAESIKTTTWRYIMRTQPFDDSDEQDRSEFRLRLTKIKEQNKEVASLPTASLTGVQISQEMERIRELSLEARIAHYKTHRIVDQQSWYAKKATYNKKMLDRFFVALLLTIALAIFFAIARVQFPAAPFWPTDFFVTTAAALLSWIQAKRFQELSTSYALAAHEISLIREQAEHAMNEAQFSEFVISSETAFSREHTQWVARSNH